MSASQLWAGTSIIFKVGIILLALALVSNGILGTYTFIQGIISSARDRAFDEKQELKDRQIDELLRQAEEARAEKAKREAEIQAKEIELAAKDALIAGASSRIQERAKEVEEIRDELLKESSRIDSLDDAAIADELRARLKARRLLKD
jgi:hypothetical protein